MAGGGGVADPLGGGAIELHHQMGAESERTGIDQGPVLHLQLQRPGARRQQGAVGRGQDGDVGIVPIQLGAELLHQGRWGHLLQTAPGGSGRQGLAKLLIG